LENPPDRIPLVRRFIDEMTVIRQLTERVRFRVNGYMAIVQPATEATVDELDEALLAADDHLTAAEQAHLDRLAELAREALERGEKVLRTFV
jgi:TATA-binding protein-associated factor Taf7